MDKLVDHMFIFQGDGKVQDFLGNYSQWKTKSTQEKYNASSAKSTTKEVVKEVEEKRKLSYHEKKEMQDIEAKIEKFNKRKLEIEQLFLDGIQDNAKINELSKELGEIQSETDTIEMRWLELSELL